MYILILIILSYSISLISPYEQKLQDGAVIYLTTYPNIPLVLEFDPKVGKDSYDVYIIDLPEGWATNPLSRFQNPIRILITPSDNSLGEYIIPITFIDEYEINPLPNITVFLYVNVSRDMYRVYVDKDIQGNFRQPVRFNVRIDSKTPNTYIISAKSYNNRFFREVYVKSNFTQQIEFIYPFEGIFQIDIEVKPKYSKTMNYQTIVNATITGDIFRDFEAYRYGGLLFFQYNSIVASMVNLIYQFLNR